MCIHYNVEIRFKLSSACRGVRAFNHSCALCMRQCVTQVLDDFADRLTISGWRVVHILKRELSSILWVSRIRQCDQQWQSWILMRSSWWLWFRAHVFGLLHNRATNCKGAIAPVNTMEALVGSDSCSQEPSGLRREGNSRAVCEWRGSPPRDSDSRFKSMKERGSSFLWLFRVVSFSNYLCSWDLGYCEKSENYCILDNRIFSQNLHEEKD